MLAGSDVSSGSVPRWTAASSHVSTRRCQQTRGGPPGLRRPPHEVQQARGNVTRTRHDRTHARHDVTHAAHQRTSTMQVMTGAAQVMTSLHPLISAGLHAMRKLAHPIRRHAYAMRKLADSMRKPAYALQQACHKLRKRTTSQPSRLAPEPATSLQLQLLLPRFGRPCCWLFRGWLRCPRSLRRNTWAAYLQRF